MNSMRRFFLCLIVTGVLSVSHSGWAGFAPIALEEDGTPSPFFHETIRLDSQDVTVSLWRESRTVDGVYRFFNTGETVKQLLGFPMRKKTAWALFRPDVEKIEAWIGNDKLVFTEKSGSLGGGGDDFQDPGLSNPYTGFVWMITEVTFPGHSSLTIRSREVAPFHQAMPVYNFKIDRYWKDKIKKGCFTLDASGRGGALKTSGLYSPLGTPPRFFGKYLVKYEIANYESSEAWTVSLGSEGEIKPVAVPRKVQPVRKEEEHKFRSEFNEFMSHAVFGLKMVMAAKFGFGLKILKGKVVSVGYWAMAIQVDESVSKRPIYITRTDITSVAFQWPKLNEMVEVKYLENNKNLIAVLVKVIEPQPTTVSDPPQLVHSIMP